MTLSELSRRNARRQVRDYLVYFVTVILAVALMYAFNGLAVAGEIRELSAFMQSMPYIVGLASVVVVIIIGWLISYTMNFMLSKRSRELGTYILMGMENKEVAGLFFWENLFIGSVAFMVGVLLGNLIYQSLNAIIMSLFDINYSFSYSFSLGAVLLTLAYFLLIYSVVLRRNRKRISRMNIHSLIYFDRRNETELVKKESIRRRMFVISLVCGVAGTALLMLRKLKPGMVGAVLIIASLYGFFISFSSGVPAWFEKRPNSKFRGTNLLTFRFLSSKMNTMGVVMGTISLLFTAAMIAVGSGLLFNIQIERSIERMVCFDLYIASSEPDSDFTDYEKYVHETLSIESEHQYYVYKADGKELSQLILDSGIDNWQYYEMDTLMCYSDYAKLREMMGYEPVELEQGSYIIHCEDHLADLMEGYDQDFESRGYTLRKDGVYHESFTQYLWDGNGRGFIMVVPDEVAQAHMTVTKSYALMVHGKVSEEVNSYLDKLQDKRSEGSDSYDTVMSNDGVRIENISMYAMIVFPLFYLAFILMITAATILTTQLLSDSVRYQRQLQMLDSMGMSKKDMGHALRRQFGLFYSMPALPPLLISIPFIVALGGAFDDGIVSSLATMQAILGTVGLFFAVYLIYVVIAYTSFKKNVIPE